MEKTALFSVLNDWNFWDKDFPNLIVRMDYQQMIEEYSASNEILLLKGVRRSGKSSLLINHMKHLHQKGIKKEELLYINFEDPRLHPELSTNLLEQIQDVYKEFVNNETKPYLFLDEIQNLHLWEKWVLMQYELNKAYIFITGSSSKLLSKEFGTALSGRYLSINVYPLSFKEYLNFKNIDLPTKSTFITNRTHYKIAFNSYIVDGGFPLVTLMTENLQKQEIMMYYDTIILKDIVARYNLKNYDNVKKVALYMMSNIGKPLNLNNIRMALNLSYELVEKYYEYLKDTYLFFEIIQFDYSLKKQFSGKKKIYCIDNGMMSNTAFRISEDYGRYMENLVFVELIRRNKEIFYHQKSKECDFILKDQTQISEAIQVCRSLLNETTKEREINGLLEAMEIYQLSNGLILTEDEEETIIIKEKTITILPLWKWLLA